MATMSRTLPRRSAGPRPCGECLDPWDQRAGAGQAVPAVWNVADARAGTRHAADGRSRPDRGFRQHAAGPGTPAALSARAQTGLALFNQDGQQVGTVTTAGLGQNQINAAVGANEPDQATPVAPENWLHIVDYSPTWPYWSITKPTLTVTKFIDSKTIEFTYLPDTMPWTKDLFVGSHLYDINSQYYYANSTIGSMTGNAATPENKSPLNTLKLSVPDNFQPSIVGHQIVIANDQLSDSDFYNSAFKDLWSTPRYEDTDGTKLNDLQVMQKLGVTKESNTGQNAIRLYDWGGSRGFSSLTAGVSEHLAFLNAAQAAGLKVIVPVSNFFLGDKDAWNGAAPDASYSPTNGIPQAVQNALEYFLKSISADGKGRRPAPRDRRDRGGQRDRAQRRCGRQQQHHQADPADPLVDRQPPATAPEPGGPSTRPTRTTSSSPVRSRTLMKA